MAALGPVNSFYPPSHDVFTAHVRTDARLLLSPRGWWYAIRRAFWRVLIGIDTDTAATLTYYSVLSLFPILLALVSMVSVMGHADQITTWIVELLRLYAPTNLAELLEDPIRGLTSEENANWVLGGSLAVAIWSASGYVASFGRAMNRIYGVEEGRPIWKIIPYNLFLTVMTLMFGLSTVFALLLTNDFVEAIVEAAALQPDAVWMWNTSRWPVLIVLAVIYVNSLYFFTPNIRPNNFRWFSIGSSLALALMFITTAVFSFFVTNFGRWNAMYGIVGSFIVMLLGLWLVNLTLIFGGRLNAEALRVYQLEHGIDACKKIKLTLRDDHQIRANKELRKRYVAEARAILRKADDQSNSDQSSSEPR